MEYFHPLIEKWFSEKVGEPTEVQRIAWPRIAAGEHVLVSAPTGSGKTMTAFLWALHQLIVGAWSSGETRVLYVSPLKALNNDIQRNLIRPLDELAEYFQAAGSRLPELRVLTRSGDTPPEERRRMARRPPEILITTPESLNILLTSKGGRGLLTGVETVILDEVHAVVSSKRGTHLITAVDRLVQLSGEFQRVALSATVKPLDRVAEWVGGYMMKGELPEVSYRRRAVSIVESEIPKRYDIHVRFMGEDHESRSAASEQAEGPSPGRQETDPFWTWLVEELKQPLGANRSTLIFANSRQMVEKLARLVNESLGAEVVYSHHGSLSREIRLVVERYLKEGRLRGIVATNSLELGIDIGSLDEVVLVQTPFSLNSAIQRIGRAGHGVGEVSVARFHPLFARDIVDAAVVTRAVRKGEIEPALPVEGPLDVLSQVILSMAATETWRMEELYTVLRSSYPYHHITRQQFDLVLEMLAGRYSSLRVRELRPLVSIDKVEGTVRGRPGADRTVYLSGGTIPERGYYQLRHRESKSRIGELDEEFVWERSVGDSFNLGVQGWVIEEITHNDVLVRSSGKVAGMSPFWRADARDRTFDFAERIGNFLEEADGRLEEGAFRAELETEYGLREEAAASLLGFLRAQRRATRSPLPHRHHIVAEHVKHPGGKGEDGKQLIIHTIWGGRVNRPLGVAWQAAWEERHGAPLQVAHNDDCLVVEDPGGLRLDDLFSLVTPDRLEELLRKRLEATGFFGALFRQAAGRALLLPRQSFRQRVPLWLIRARAKRLLEATRKYEDFPVLLETWRECIKDHFDLAALGRLLEEVREGRISMSEVRTATPSPFASGVIYRQTESLMYDDDTPEGVSPSALRRELLREVVFSSHLRPRISRELIRELEQKLKRTAEGYAPGTSSELLHWVVERVVIPVKEWEELLAAIARDHDTDPDEMLRELGNRLVGVATAGSREPVFVCAVESWERVLAGMEGDESGFRLSSILLDGSTSESALEELRALRSRGDAGTVSDEPGAEDAGMSPGDLLGELLQFYGPVRVAELDRVFPGIDQVAARRAMEDLRVEERIVLDEISEHAQDPEVCDAENLERLLRMTRAEARPSFEARPPEELPLFLATHQGLATSGAELDDLRSSLEQLFGYPASPEAWESHILPARLEPYHSSWLDALLAEGDLVWIGCGEKKLGFALESELELFGADLVGGAAGTPTGDSEGPSESEADVASLFPHESGSFSFRDLLRHSGLAPDLLANRLWELAWQRRVTNTAFAPVRTGVQTNFSPPSPRPAGDGRGRRWRRPDRWQGLRGVAGGWRRLPEVDTSRDALEEEELNKDRVRQLLERYGVLFRELLDRELPDFRWGKLFRTLRLMELSGEVLSGHFFSGVPGPTFMSHAAFRRLRGGLDQDKIFWVNATDPVSPCGWGLSDLKGGLPRRLPSAHLVFHGSRPVIVSEKNGGRLRIRVEPDDPRLPRYLDYMRVMLTRQFNAATVITVEEINGEPAADSLYRGVLATIFDVSAEAGSLLLRRRYH